jgi:hypothetical protein
MPGCIAEVFAANNEQRIPDLDATHGRVVSKEYFAALMMEKLTEELILKQEDVEAQAIGDHLLTNAVLNIKTHCRNSTTVSRTKANMTAVFSVYKAIFVGKYAHSYVRCCYLK